MCFSQSQLLTLANRAIVQGTQ